MEFPGWRKAGWKEKALTIFLGIVVLAAIGGIAYLGVARNGAGGDVTQFYLLGENRVVGAYPRDLKVNTPTSVTLGIINRDIAPANYAIKVYASGALVKLFGVISLGAGETWEGAVDFTAPKAGSNQPVLFYVYRNDDSRPCLPPLKLTVNVRE